ncbi:MAG: hypothetical protein ACREUZ_23150 [Burkholderiales bacterium]
MNRLDSMCRVFKSRPERSADAARPASCYRSTRRSGDESCRRSGLSPYSGLVLFTSQLDQRRNLLVGESGAPEILDQCSLVTILRAVPQVPHTISIGEEDCELLVVWAVDRFYDGESTRLNDTHVVHLFSSIAAFHASPVLSTSS